MIKTKGEYGYIYRPNGKGTKKVTSSTYSRGKHDEAYFFIKAV